jgi:hypothetical protein
VFVLSPAVSFTRTFLAESKDDLDAALSAEVALCTHCNRARKRR